MRRHEQQSITRTEEFWRSTVCDRCGKEMGNHKQGYEQGAEWRASFGYGSSYDMEHFAVDLCDACSLWLFEEVCGKQRD